MLLLVIPCIWSWIRMGGLLPLVWTGVAGCIIFAVMLIAPSMWRIDGLDEFKHQVETIVARQTSTFEGYKADNLAGRTNIWEAHLQSLDDRPWTWMVGYGFGSAITRGNQAHMQPLNMVSEIGLIGLAIGLVLMGITLKALWDWEAAGHPMLWGTVALLFTSLTQETLYPVAAFGHFLGFYLVAVAIALRLAADIPATSDSQPPPDADNVTTSS